MNWILGIVILLILYFLFNSNRKKKRKLKALNELIENWGKAKHPSEFHFRSIKKYFKNNHLKSKAFHIISDRCASDLDLDAIFKVIDRTCSKIGQQFLYFKLRTVGNLEDLNFFKDLTQVFEEDKSLRQQIQLKLLRLNSNDSYNFEELVTSKPIDKPKILWLIYTLALLSFSFILLGFFFPIFFILLVPILTLNLVFHYKNKWNISSYLDGVIQLSRVLKVSKEIAAFSEIKKFYPRTAFNQKLDKVKFKTAFISFEKNMDNEFASIFWVFSEFVKITFNIEYIIFYSFIDDIKNSEEELRQVFHFVGEIDCAISTASLKASGQSICHPEFTPKKKLIVKEISHPLLSDCVVNDLSLKNSSLLLTGSNMSGKTTFIRSVAINTIFAQTLNICFAKKFTAPFFKIYSSIRITDDLLENTSYYLEEVTTIKKLITASSDKNPCLFVLDEIFKGTNTIERISGGKAILSYLNKENNMVLVSTHDIELTDLLNKENYELYHFSEHIENNQLKFDHKLKPGKLKSRNAIKILEIYNYPKEIVEDAKFTEFQNFKDSP